MPPPASVYERGSGSLTPRRPDQTGLARNDHRRVEGLTGLGAWKGTDEPLWGAKDAQGLADAYEFVRLRDPAHPMVIIQAPRAKVKGPQGKKIEKPLALACYETTQQPETSTASTSTPSPTRPDGMPTGQTRTSASSATSPTSSSSPRPARSTDDLRSPGAGSIHRFRADPAHPQGRALHGLSGDHRRRARPHLLRWRSQTSYEPRGCESRLELDLLAPSTEAGRDRTEFRLRRPRPRRATCTRERQGKCR